MKLEGLDYLVVGDVTGYGKTLIELHKQAPHLKLIGLGDIIDRGPNSKLALEYFVSNGFHSVMGNHDHFLWFEKHKNDPDVMRRLYPDDCWLWNGGAETLNSFGFPNIASFSPDKIDQKIWDFIESMPLKIEVDKFVLTHAPIGYDKRNFFDFREINKNEYVLDRSALWNRQGPYSPNKEKNKDYAGKVQLYGHNSPKGVLFHTDRHLNGIYRDQELAEDPSWAICLDTWRAGHLSGLDLSTMKVYRQDILDEEK